MSSLQNNDDLEISQYTGHVTAVEIGTHFRLMRARSTGTII